MALTKQDKTTQKKLTDPMYRPYKRLTKKGLSGSYKNVTSAMINPKINVEVDVDGVAVKGKILHLFCNDIEVQITSPYKQAHMGRHMPHFGMCEMTYLIKNGVITEFGVKKAESLLREIYLHCLKEQ